MTDQPLMAQLLQERRAAKRAGTLKRSQTVSVSLDPKTNYLCELAARCGHRSKSAFIEWAIERYLEDQHG